MVFHVDKTLAGSKKKKILVKVVMQRQNNIQKTLQKEGT